MKHVNFQLLMEEQLKRIKESNTTPSLLLHACCAPCSSYVLECLSKYFNISILYYNPNITSEEEYNKRFNELKRFIREVKFNNPINIININYTNQEFIDMSKGLEYEKEGGKRCYKCYHLRLDKTAKYALLNGFDYFTTTLSISPYKNSEWLNQIGEELSDKYGIKYLYADFKKKNGYKRSIELSKIYKLYRQDYCGCIFSKRDRIAYLKKGD